MSDESAVVYVCVMDGVHWHLYPPVNLWANAVLVSVSINAAEVHERTVMNALGASVFVMMSASIDPPSTHISLMSPWDTCCCSHRMRIPFQRDSLATMSDVAESSVDLESV